MNYDQLQPSHISNFELQGQQAFIILESRLPDDDPVNEILAAAGIMGKAIVDIEAGSQRFAVIDVSEASNTITGIRARTYEPLKGVNAIGDKSPTHYELEDKYPFVLVHLAQDGTVTGRALRKEEPITIGRAAHLEDKKSDRFDYEDDLKLSRRHLKIALDVQGSNIAVEDLNSSNGTIVRYSSRVSVEVTSTKKDVARATRAEQVAPNATQTNELLHRPEFLPTKAIEVDDRNFWLSNITRSRSGRDHAIMYTTIPKDGQTLAVPRMLYKSNSDGGWRVAYGVDSGEDGRYIKEAHDVGPAHYTQETKLHPAIIKALETLPVQQDLNGVLTQDIRRIFDTQARGFEQTNTASREVTYYTDPKLDGKVRAMRLLSAGDLSVSYLRYVKLRMKGVESMSDYFEGINKAIEVIPGFIPAFENGPNQVAAREHTLLGRITVEDFPAKYGNKNIVWSIGQDAYGRTWIDNIRLAESAVSSYGTYATVFDGGILTSKPLDYKEQVSGVSMMYGEAVPFDGDYNDITPLLGILLPIKRYRAAKQHH
jgi:hypothetical protein